MEPGKTYLETKAMGPNWCPWALSLGGMHKHMGLLVPSLGSISLGDQVSSGMLIINNKQLLREL